MKGLNVRLLAILVGAGLVLAIVGFGLHRFQVRRLATHDLDKARELNQLPDLVQRMEAVKWYRRYLGLRPRQTDARAELALLYADLAEKDRQFRGPAFTNLEQVLREDPLRDDARRKAIDLAVSMREFNDAREHLLVLQNHAPNDGRLFELLAQCQSAQGEYNAAGKSYESAISLTPDHLEAYVGLASLLLAHGKEMTLPSVDPKNDRPKKDTASPDAAKNGAAKEGAAKDDAAKDSTAKNDATKDNAAKTDATKPDVTKTTATKTNDAEYWINKMVERNPKAAKAYYYRADYFIRVRRLEDARKDALTALELTPNDEDTLLLMVRIAGDEGDFVLAREHGRRAVELFKNSPKVYQALSNLEMRAEDPKKAREWLESGLVNTEEDPSLLWEKAVLLISQGEFDSIRPLIDQIVGSASTYSHPVLVGYLEGRLAFAQKEWARAVKYFEQIRTDLRMFSPSMARQANYCLAECYEKLNRREAARSILDDLRASERGRLAQGADSWQQLAAQGQLPQAIARCRAISQRPDAPPAIWTDLAKLLVYYNERVPEENRDWTEAENAVKKMAELTPESPDLPIFQAKILIGQRRFDETRDLLEQAVQKDPARWELWDPLVMLAQANKDWDRASRLLDEADKHVAAKTSIYLARARLAVERDGEKASEELKQFAAKAEGMADSEKVFFWRMMAGFCLKAKDFQQAKELCKKVAEGDPTNLQIRVLLFEIAKQVQDQTAMKQAVDEIGRIEQQGPIWRYYTAQLLVVAAELKNKNEKDEDKAKKVRDAAFKKAIPYLKQARLDRPQWDAVPMLLARIQDQMGDRDTAIENYLAAVELGSRDVLGLRRVNDLLLEEGRSEEANKIAHVLDQAGAGVSSSALIRRGLQQLAEGDVEGGAKNIEQVADDLRKSVQKSNDYREYHRLSQILRTLGQIAAQRKQRDEADKYFDEAHEALRQATELSPKNANLWIDQITLLAVAGRVRDVDGVLNQAKEKLPPDEVAVTLARCYEVLQRSAEAEVEYDKAAEQAKDNKDLARLMARFFLRSNNEEKRKKGEAILRDMIDGRRPVQETDVPWARRQLCVLLSQRGDHRSYHDAVALVDANLKDEPDSALDKRLKARLLARRPSRAERRQARTIFEELVNLPKPSPDDAYELARLYFADEQWNRASQQMRPLIAAKNIRPEWLDFYIRALIRAGEFGGAEALLNRYATMVDNPFPVVVMRARIFSGRKRHDQAIRVIRDYVEDVSSVVATRPTRARQATQALENLAKHVTGAGRDAAIEQYLKQAEIYLREYVEQDPSNTMLLVGFLGRRGQRAEALKIAEEAWEKDQPIPIAVTAVGLLVTGDPAPDEIQRVEKIVDAALKKHGDAIPLLLAMAELRSTQKRYDEAEKTYRDVLAKEPENIVALNNLAVFLSLRGLKLDESLEMINKAIELAGPVATLLDSRATVYLAKGQWQESLDDLNMALSEEPTGIRFFHQAQAYMLGGKQAEARVAMQKADGYGLKVDQLQPLERPAYRKIKEELK